MSKTAYIRDVLGFDLSKPVPFSREIKVRCSQCEALVINETPCHETGCPHATHECAGCNERVPVRQRWCADCQ